MKAFFVGLGSTGQRHLVNFKRIMGKDAEISAYRKTNHNILINSGISKPIASLENYYGFRQFNDLDNALKEFPDIVFITNPTSKHIEVALKAAEYGCNLFIEKPLSHNLDGVETLKKKMEEGNLIATIGYQTRFHPCYKLVYNILSERKYGNVISASFEWGTYLPSHHPYEDYRKGYAAVKSLGGGVILGLIHEIDILCSFWGQPETLSAIGGKLGSLGIDVEDTVSTLLSFKQGERIFPVTLFLSYAQTKEVRRFRIQLDEATIFCDLLENSMDVFDKKGKPVTKLRYSELERNDLFMEEMKDFISAVKGHRQPQVSLSDGIESLKLAMKIKEKMGEVHHG